MTITQLSNLFNLIVQNDAEYNFYHYGWPSDMNLNIQNNSDPNALTGRLFPYVLFMPPAVQARAMDNNVNSIFDTYTCELLITDTYAYNQGILTYKADTTIEIEQKLQVLAKKLIQYILDYSDVSIPPFNVSDYNIEFDPYRFAADTRSIRVRFSLVFPAICDDSNLDISFLPDELSDIGVQDYEANMDYCPVLGLNADVIIGTGPTGPNWDAQADLTAFIAQINAHPDFVGGLNIDSHKFVDSNGATVGNNTYFGVSLFCDKIDKNLTEIFYQMSVSAIFNAGSGPRIIQYTLTVTIPQPTITVDYTTNLYTCQDLGYVQN
jgi:hypothetical protein